MIGLRLILLFGRDVGTVCDIIRRSFKVISQENTLERLEESQFGYSSVHFILEMPEEWVAVPTLSQLNNLRAEVQVRTAAQHIWAAASHILQYKQESSVPKPILRSIYRISALLGTVDLEFERILKERQKYQSELSTRADDEVLNVDSIKKILCEILPKENQSGDEDYTNLLNDLLWFSVDTPRKLSALLLKYRPEILRKDQETAAEFPRTESGFRWNELLRRDKYYNHAGLTRIAISLEFSEEWDVYLMRRYRNHEEP